MHTRSKIVVLCQVLMLLTTNAHAQQRPNILLIMAEDMSARVGAFGDEVAVTPNLDRLARRSRLGVTATSSPKAPTLALISSAIINRIFGRCCACALVVNSISTWQRTTIFDLVCIQIPVADLFIFPLICLPLQGFARELV